MKEILLTGISIKEEFKFDGSELVFESRTIGMEASELTTPRYVAECAAS